MEFEFSLQFFETYSNTEFYASSEPRKVSCGQRDGQKDRRIDRHDDANSCFLQLYEYTKSKYHNEKPGILNGEG